MGNWQSRAYGSRTLWEASKPADRGAKGACGTARCATQAADYVAAGNLNITTKCSVARLLVVATGVVDVGPLDASET
jgi:hypothetical protein